jgi:23S rRNA pseudouridine1911/1915/1917 synthase
VVRVLPKTGRTHQIRLHLGHVGCPVLCDRLYGGRSQVTRGELAPGAGDEVILARQALHAVRLSLVHPLTRQPLSVEAPLPEDLRQVLAVLRGGESPTTG